MRIMWHVAIDHHDVYIYIYAYVCVYMYVYIAMKKIKQLYKIRENIIYSLY